MKITSLSCGVARRAQAGVALFIALISLVALSFAGLALMRSVDTTNVISGNLAFRQAALHATDVGVESAMTALGIIIGASSDANYPAGCAVGLCNYYATQQAEDARGIPSTIDWSVVPSAAVDVNYKVQYVIDRLCKGPLPVTDIAGNCYAGEKIGGGTHQNVGKVFSSTQQVYFRATVRVVGPRNTVSFVQTIFKN